MKDSFVQSCISSRHLEAKLFIHRATVLLVAIEEVVNLVQKLNTDFLFVRPLTVINNSAAINCGQLVQIISNIFDDEVIIIVDIHNEIVITTKHVYEKMFGSLSYGSPQQYKDYDALKEQLKKKALKTPIKIYPKADTKNIFWKIEPEKLSLCYNDQIFEIKRAILDMLYVDGEPFNPTQDKTKHIEIRTQCRHQIYIDGYQSLDLLRSDIALICYTQDRLKDKIQNLQ